MTKHIILWKLKETMADDEKAVVKENIKKSLEQLKGIIPGLVGIEVHTEGLPSSTADLMLDSTFESADALKNYATHPAHVAVANGVVRPNVQTRLCLDYNC